MRKVLGLIRKHKRDFASYLHIVVKMERGKRKTEGMCGTVNLPGRSMTRDPWLEDAMDLPEGEVGLIPSTSTIDP